MRDGIPPDTHPRPQSALANTGPAESDYSSCTFACTPEPAGFQADDEPGQRLPERVVVQYAHQPSLLRPAPSARPHNWMELEAITLGLTGRPPETGYRELVVPVFRLAQMEIDREGRQPGEANAWIDPGPRFLDRKPIDVSALEAMRTQWAQVMAAVARLRQAYLDRYPLARSGMTLGDLERLSALVLAVVASPQVKKDRRGARELHPVLSSMVRVADGLRLTAHQMLFIPGREPARLPSSRVTAAEILAYAERHDAFHSAQGVRAAPGAMIEQFLALVVDGAGGEQFAHVALDDPVREALAGIGPAFDHGLLALQGFALVFSLWPLMTRTYARLAGILEHWPGVRTPAVARLHDALAEKGAVLRSSTNHAAEQGRENRDRACAESYQQCALGLGDPLQADLRTRVAGRLLGPHREASRVLRRALERRCADSEASGVAALHACLIDCFVRTQEILALAGEVQHRLNTLLQRPQPGRQFSASDLDIHILLQGDEARRLPNLLLELERLLGLRVHITAQRLDITERLQA